MKDNDLRNHRGEQITSTYMLDPSGSGSGPARSGMWPEGLT